MNRLARERIGHRLVLRTFNFRPSFLYHMLLCLFFKSVWIHLEFWKRSDFCTKRLSSVGLPNGDVQLLAEAKTPLPTQHYRNLKFSSGIMAINWGNRLKWIFYCDASNTRGFVLDGQSHRRKLGPSFAEGGQKHRPNERAIPTLPRVAGEALPPIRWSSQVVFLGNWALGVLPKQQRLY